MELAAPPRPVKSKISDCAIYVWRCSPSIGRAASSFLLFSLAASFCAVTVGRTCVRRVATRAFISPMSWSAHVHRGTALPIMVSARVSGWWLATSHMSQTAAHGPQERFLQPQRMLLSSLMAQRLVICSGRRQAPHF